MRQNRRHTGEDDAGKGFNGREVRRTYSTRNRRFYDLLWSGARLVEPQRFNTWPLVRSLLPNPVDGSRLRPA